MPTPRSRAQSILGESGSHYEDQLNKSTGKLLIIRNHKNVAYVAKSQTMDDATDGDHKTPNPAYSSKTTRRGGYANGSLITDSAYYRSTRIVSSLRCLGMSVNPPAFDASLLPERPTIYELATRAMSLSTPGRATSSLPVTIAEFKDIPRMFRDLMASDSTQIYLEKVRRQYWGRDHLRKSTRWRVLRKRKKHDGQNNSIVGMEFGLLPLVRDLAQIFKLPKSVDDRIDRMQANMGILVDHRSVYDESFSGPRQSVNFHTDGFVCSAYRQTHMRESCRATVRWTPRWSGPQTSDQKTRDIAASYATGMSFDQVISNAYELMPWSWLIDWFGNTGDFLMANSALMNYTADVTMSIKQSAQYTFDPYNTSSWINVTAGRITREVWVRSLSVPPIWAPISPSGPALGMKQLLILSSIAANKGRYIPHSR